MDGSEARPSHVATWPRMAWVAGDECLPRTYPTDKLTLPAAGAGTSAVSYPSRACTNAPW